MKTLITLLGAVMILHSCSPSQYDRLSAHFPEVDSLPVTFRYQMIELPDPIDTPLIEGVVRPIGKLSSANCEFLIVNDNGTHGKLWGQVTGYLFIHGILMEEVVLARKSPHEYRHSTLDRKLKLHFLIHKF